MKGIWQELSRRNVPRVAAGYIVTAWLLIQVVETILPAFGVGDAAVRVVTIIAVIGFIPMLVLAWVFELTFDGLVLDSAARASGRSRGISTRNVDRIIIVSLLAALGLFTFDEFVVEPAQEATGTATKRTDTRQTLLVLPFASISSDSENKYFAEGMSDELRNLLGRVPAFRVMGRATSYNLAAEADIQEASRQLGVDSVLEGSVIQSGDTVRISVQLVDADDGLQRWSESYERATADVFDVHDEVTSRILTSLDSMTDTPPLANRPTSSEEAYALFLKARILHNNQQGREVIPLLKTALELDPRFAIAEELMAASYWSQSGDIISAQDGFRHTAAAAKRALALDPDRPFAQALFELTRGGPNAHFRGIQALQKAIKLSPNDTTPFRPLVYELTYLGYFEEAHRTAERFLALDPLSPVAILSLAETLWATGDKQTAMSYLRSAHELGNWFAVWELPCALLALGMRDEARLAFDDYVTISGLKDTGWSDDLFNAQNREQMERAILTARNANRDVVLSNWADPLELVALILGYGDYFFELIRSHGPTSDHWTDADALTWGGVLYGRPAFTENPEFPQIAEALGLTATWEVRGEPDFCHRNGDDWNCH